MCLEPEDDVCGLRWCLGLQMRFLTRGPASFGLVVVQQLLLHLLSSSENSA